MDLFIKNKQGQKIAVKVEGENNTKGPVFILHGMWTNMDRPTGNNIAEACVKSGYTAVRFDARNHRGKSDGRPEDATITEFYQDLKEVINWGSQQTWYKEPFILAGSSLGGITAGLYAEDYPKRVKALFLLSPVVSGELNLSAKAATDPESIKIWKTQGVQEREFNHETGEKKFLPWSHMEDKLKYNLLPKAHDLTMPVLIVVGDKDTTCPLEHQKMLFEKLGGKKQLEIMVGAEHGSKDPQHQKFMKDALITWMKEIS
ncbi:MAG TPA: alpha/beta hydrolase [Candidatus Limnocylindria bacterium]|nr:alpha/beta hydrolase [Candidatus Limnocylindria bacterium]